MDRSPTAGRLAVSAARDVAERDLAPADYVLEDVPDRREAEGANAGQYRYEV
jgi:hypothetical protein